MWWLSLVDGWELDTWRTAVAPLLDVTQSEERFKIIAVQLLQVMLVKALLAR